jgi:hypothetical protein
LNVDVVEAELTERERRSIDQEAGWRKVRTEQTFLSDEQWAELFAKRDRQSIILACIPLIDFYNKTSPDYVKQEIASYAMVKATEAVDKLLTTPHPTPKAHLSIVIKHAVGDARIGKRVEARECVSTSVRRIVPRKRPTDAERDRLVAKWRNEGMSESMIEAELDSRGLKAGPSLKRVQVAMPRKRERDDDKCFTEIYIAPDVSFSTDQKDWQFLTELMEGGVITQEQLDWLRLKARGYTNVEIFEEFGVTADEQTQIKEDIRAAIQGYAQRQGFDQGDL